MSRITEKQDKLLRDFRQLEDSFEQYAYLIELSCLLPAMDPGKKTDEKLVKGCQSSVWLDIWQKDERFFFSGDSDTLILKGILYLLTELFCGEPPSDVAGADVTLFRQSEITGSFEDSRRKGIGYILETLQSAAATMAEKAASPESVERTSNHEAQIK